MFKHLAKSEFMPSNKDAGILVLRVFTSLSLFLKHGVEKIFTFGEMSKVFSDPLHIGHAPSLVLAMLSDSICSLLILVGFGTRWACAYSFCVIAVAWGWRHNFLFFGAHGAGDHGELIVLYLAALLAVFVAGPGRYSVDAILCDD